MGAKTVAICLVVLVGAVAAYDINFLRERYRKPQDATAENAGQEQQPDGQPEALERGENPGPGDTDEERGESDNGRAEGPPATARRQAGGEEARTDWESGEIPNEDQAMAQLAQKLPAVFDMEWANPFGQEGGAAVETGEGPVPAGPLTGGWQNPFVSRTPTVSAVLIGSTKRAIIDRRIVREGDRLSDIGARVETISADGVALNMGGEVRFFPVSSAAAGAVPADEQ